MARGFLSTLRAYGDELPAGQREDAFQTVDEALDRIQGLAEGALLQSPDAAGTGPSLPAAPIDVRRLLQDLEDSLSHYREDVSIDARVEESCCASFIGDRRLVRELLENLVTNALKHSPPGEVVRVTARLEGSSIRFDVTDRGPGIPPEEQGQVFEHFYRTRRSAAEGTPGAGVGLGIVRQLAELQGGVVGVSSRVDQGATFWVTLPLDAAQSTAPTLA